MDGRIRKAAEATAAAECEKHDEAAPKPENDSKAADEWTPTARWTTS